MGCLGSVARILVVSWLLRRVARLVGGRGDRRRG